MKYLKNRSFYLHVFVFILIAQRFFHLSGSIDEPHAWRQFDTYFYAWDFYKNGIHLFAPSVCWMGGYKTLILEFPVISAIISIFFSLIEPSVFIARTVVFLFYLGSAVYLYKLVKFLTYQRLARLTLIMYLMLPMSFYYSRSVQIDFPAMFFSLAMLYYFVIGYNRESIPLLLTGMLLGVFAFLIKSPYAFYMYIPLLYYVIKNKKVKLFSYTLPVLIIPAVIFVIWQAYSVKVSSSAPDWYFIPGYFKFSSMGDWYFGYLSQRIDVNNWKTIIGRFVESSASFIGIIFFVFGLLAGIKSKVSHTFFYFYTLGVIAYLIIFFNLNVIHEYYQIPFLVISSYFIAVSLDYIYCKLFEKSQTRALVITSICIFILSVNCVWFTERWYYKPDRLRLDTSEYIQKNTEENSLIIASINSTDPRDPRILAGSLRYGWAVDMKDLTPVIIDSLKHYGAQYLSVTSNEELNPILNSYLSRYKSSGKNIFKDNWVVRLYRLE